MMTQAQAQAEAVRRWGEGARARLMDGGFPAVARPPVRCTDPWMAARNGTVTTWFAADTFEDAFLLAEASPE